MDQLNGSQSPPPPSPARLYKPGESREQIVLLGAYYGRWLHWVSGRSLPCLDDDCPRARHNKPSNWMGYFPACRLVERIDQATGLRKQTPFPIVLAVGPDFTEKLGDGHSYPILVEVQQRKSGRGLDLVRVREIKDPTGLPACFDVKLVLYRLFGIRPPTTYPETNHESEQE